MSANHYDVVIVGTGAGGGTLAFKLAPSGKRILLLERGDYVPRETDNWSTRAVNVQGKYQTKEIWYDKAGKPLHPHTNYWVGGNTKFYGAALFRLRRRDFGEIRHAGGISPAWPISYDEMEPYYLQAEHLYEVRGERGADPTEPEASGPYRFPAVSHEPRIQKLHDALAKRALLLATAAVPADASADVLVDGQSNLLAGKADLERAKVLLRTLEEKDLLVRLLDRTLAAPGICVFIGAEANLADLTDVSVVAAPYGAEGRPLGTIGVIGPARMNYSRVIPLVDFTAEMIGETLAKP